MTLSAKIEQLAAHCRSKPSDRAAHEKLVGLVKRRDGRATIDAVLRLYYPASLVKEIISRPHPFLDVIKRVVR